MPSQNSRKMRRPDRAQPVFLTSRPSGSGLRGTYERKGHLDGSRRPTLPRHATMDSSTVRSHPGSRASGMCSLKASAIGRQNAHGSRVREARSEGPKARTLLIFL